MSDYRIKEHPVLDIPPKQEIPFFWEGREMRGQEGEMISAALFANGVRTFSYHHKDDAPLGLFAPTGNAANARSSSTEGP